MGAWGSGASPFALACQTTGTLLDGEILQPNLGEPAQLCDWARLTGRTSRVRHRAL